jgi:hypothetical protein
MAEVDLSLLGPCGIYCGTCDIRVACLAADRATQQRIADWLKEHHDMDVAAGAIRCGGCWGPVDEHWSADCKVLACARARGVRVCSDCDEYPGCETLEAFYQGGDYRSARSTLERIREIGLDAWAGEKAAELEERP